MKINEPNRMSQLMATYQKNAQRVKSTEGAVKPAGFQSDGVSLSPEALSMAREWQSESTDRAVHLAAVKERIQGGTYQVETSLVVKKMRAAYGDFE